MARASVSARSTEKLLGAVGSFELWIFIGREFDDVHQPRQTIRTGLSSPYRCGRSSSA
jgi:hypothetical protein